MSGQTLCIRTFAEAIRPKMSKTSKIRDFDTDTMTTENGGLVRVFYPLLLNAVIYKAKGDGEEGLPDISAKMATELKNGNGDKPEVHPKIKEIAARDETRRLVGDFFAVNIIPNIINDALEIVVDSVDAIVQSDKSLGNHKAKALREASKRNNPADFLARAFLLAITVGTNKVVVETAVKPTREGQQLDVMTPPEEVALIEMMYVTKCMEAYGSAAHLTEFSEELLPDYPNYRRHFSRQRKDFYIAESVRRNTRDVYEESEPDHFNALMKDVHSGIIEKYEEDYDDGYKRMSAVLQKATETGIGATWLNERYEGVINDTKKGVCHILANEDTIKSWVEIDG
jgi:hypothetical protein